MIELGSFRNTAAIAVTGDEAIFTSPGPHSTYVVMANRNVLIARNNAPTNEKAFPLMEGQYAKVRLEKNETLAFVLAAGEIDGTIYLTECS